MPKYEVECQTLVKIVVEARDEDEAQQKALEELEEKMQWNEIDWGIFPYKLPEEGENVQEK